MDEEGERQNYASFFPLFCLGEFMRACVFLLFFERRFFSRAGGKKAASNCPSADPTHVQGDAVLKILRVFASLMI